jgi:hypothetical protein
MRFFANVYKPFYQYTVGSLNAARTRVLTSMTISSNCFWPEKEAIKKFVYGSAEKKELSY